MLHCIAANLTYLDVSKLLENSRRIFLGLESYAESRVIEHIPAIRRNVDSSSRSVDRNQKPL